MEIDKFLSFMNAKEVKPKEIKMADNEKEIHIKAVKKADDRVSLMDMEGNWYSGWKNQATPESWDLLNSLNSKDRVDIKWTVNAKGFKNLAGLSRVLRREDEVVPYVKTTIPPPGLPGETFQERPAHVDSRDDLISKQVCLKGGIEIVSAQIKSGDITMADPAGNALAISMRLYQGLKEPWEEPAQ
jgi:hypothetical protein